MYVGHTNEKYPPQPLRTHLENVAEKAANFANAFNNSEIAYQIGLCHDIGKYSREFQNRILHNGNAVDHSTAGGQVICKLAGPVGAFCVFGHHGGLANGRSRASKGDSTYASRLQKQVKDYSAYKAEISPKAVKEIALLPLEKTGFSMSMYIRMLYSCLVDADFLDTEEYMTQNQVKRNQYDSIEVLAARYKMYIQAFQNPKKEIHKKRNEILQDCIRAGEEEKGLFSLTVPTGGGKTIASMGFALTHAQKHTMQRIVYVIPYTSIIEQNAKVFEEILGEENVVEHHFHTSYENDENDSTKVHKKYLASENWDAPIIVTTNVQFFESLFANKPSKCRKLHNLANAVIVLDEAQMIPKNYLQPCVRALSELVHNYNSSVVLCTATQPALDPFFPHPIKRREICQNPEALYEFFRRTTIEYKGKLSDEKLIKELQQQKQVLCIVNTKRHAQEIYEPLQDAYHLSTLMTPIDRNYTLKTIREKLRSNQPCRVVSTSLVEAGVDLDFPIVYRAKTGLDSIIQAAGRCNREAKQSASDSKVYVFEPETAFATQFQKQYGAIFDLIAKEHTDLSCLDAIEDYFSRLFHMQSQELDQKNIVPRLENGWQAIPSFPFADIAREFKLIETETDTVIIPLWEQACAIEEKLRNGYATNQEIRALAPYCVNIYPNHTAALCHNGVIEKVDESFFVLRDWNAYSHEKGLNLDVETGQALFIDL